MKAKLLVFVMCVLFISDVFCQKLKKLDVAFQAVELKWDAYNTGIYKSDSILLYTELDTLNEELLSSLIDVNLSQSYSDILKATQQLEPGLIFERAPSGQEGLGRLVYNFRLESSDYLAENLQMFPADTELNRVLLYRNDLKRIRESSELLQLEIRSVMALSKSELLRRRQFIFGGCILGISLTALVVAIVK